MVPNQHNSLFGCPLSARAHSSTTNIVITFREGGKNLTTSELSICKYVHRILSSSGREEGKTRVIIRATQLEMCGNLLLLFKQLLGIASLLLLFRPSILDPPQVAYAECEIQNRTRSFRYINAPLLVFSLFCVSNTVLCSFVRPQSSPVSTSSGDAPSKNEV